MKLSALPMLVSTSFLLAACGGGSGGGATTNTSEPASSIGKSSSLTASSSSSSSSVTPELGCSFHEAAVYIDAACSPWQSPSVREKNGDGSVGQEVDAKQSPALSLSELDLLEPVHQRVLDIHYNKTGAANSQLRFGIANTAGLDLSAYQTGKLVFDLKVINKGDKNAPLQIALDCGWPCESTEKNIAAGALNEWKTIELSIADFIRDGLNIKQVRSGFQIMPALNQQANVHFQLDNIRWEKGPSTQPLAESCHSIHFDSAAPTSLSLRSFTGHKLPTLVGQVPTSVIKPEWSSPQERWGYGEQTLNLDETCLTSPASTFSASVYIPGAYVTDGKLRVGFYFADADNNYTTAGLTSVANLVPDSWNTIEGKLPQTQNKTRSVSTKLAATKAGFSHWGIVFDANGKDPAVTGDVRIDNIVISQNLEASSSSVSQNTSRANSSTSAASASTSADQSSSSALSSAPSSLNGTSAIALASSSALTSAASSVLATVSSSSRLASSGAQSSVRSSAPSSSLASSSCVAGSGIYTGTAPLGFGFTANSTAYLRIELSNGKFIGSPNVSIPNANITTVKSNNTLVVLAISVAQPLSSSTNISLNWNYQQQDAQLKVSRSVSVFETASGAVNNINSLFASIADLAAPCSLGPRSSSSQSSSLVTSSLARTSASSSSSRPSSISSATSSSQPASSSSVATSSAASSTATSVASSAVSSAETSSLASSASTSQSSSSASCVAVSGSHAGNVPLGIDAAANEQLYLRIDLTNGKLVGTPTVSIPNSTSDTVLQSNDFYTIILVETQAQLSSSVNVGISLDYQQQNPGAEVSRSVRLYSTASHAVSQSNPLTTAVETIDNRICN